MRNGNSGRLKQQFSTKDTQKITSGTYVMFAVTAFNHQDPNKKCFNGLLIIK